MTLTTDTCFRLIRKFLVPLIALVALSACSAVQLPPKSAIAPAGPTPNVSPTMQTALPNPTPAPRATDASSTPVARATGSLGAERISGTPTVIGTPASDPIEQAIRDVILKGNLEQVEAITRGDPTVMKDTSGSSYYDQVVQGNQQLLQSGATGIRLTQLVWGPVSAQGTTAQATTFESWLTEYKDGETELAENDQNVYDLVQTNGQWLIQADNHPNAQASRSSTGGPGSRQPTPTPVVGPSPMPGADMSRNWTGYSATGGKFTSVTGTWIVPHVNATAGSTVGSADATWVGIGGVKAKDLIQAGSEAEVVGPGDTVYDTWIELLPAAPTVVPLAVVPGDSLTVTITEAQSGTWSILLKNNTTSKAYQQTVQYQSSYSSAEWVEEAPSIVARQRAQVIPLDNFGAIQFSNDSAVRDGKTVNLAEAGAQPITMMGGASGQHIAVPSKIGADGSSFSVSTT